MAALGGPKASGDIKVSEALVGCVTIVLFARPPARPLKEVADTFMVSLDARVLISEDASGRGDRLESGVQKLVRYPAPRLGTTKGEYPSSGEMEHEKVLITYNA